MPKPVIDIFLTMYKHPEMLELVVEYLNRAEQVRDYRLTGFFEHGFDPCLEDIFDRLNFDTEKVFRQEKYGINWNTPRAWIETGERTEGEYIIQMQSDMVVTDDYFRFIDHCFDVFNPGFVTGYCGHRVRRGDDEVERECQSGMYGHWNTGVRTDIVNSLYPKYFCDEYKADMDGYAIKQFPDLFCGGSDYYINAFLFKHRIIGVRPCSSRVKNIGIDGEHIQLEGESRTIWAGMSRKEKLKVLRAIINEHKFTLKSNFCLSNCAPIYPPYKWTRLKIVDLLETHGTCGTDIPKG